MRNILRRKILVVALALLLVWLGASAYRVYRQRSAVMAQLGDIESKVSNLEQDNQRLASSSAYFASGEYLEREARLKLNYKPADEQVAFVYQSTASGSPAPSASASVPFWRSWFDYLFRRD